MGIVRCRCGTGVNVPEAGQWMPCPACGKMVTIPAAQPSGPAPPSSSPAAQSAANRCPGCGMEMGPGVRCCLRCGFEMSAPIAAQEKAAEGTNWTKVVVLLFVAIALIGGGIVIMKLRGKRQEPPPPTGGGYLQMVVSRPRAVRIEMDLISVKQSIQAFQVNEGRLPKSLDELNQQNLTVPPPPTGYKYVYNSDTGEVNLVREETQTPPP